MSSPANRLPIGRAKSCVVCRQFKLKCDARKTAPDPCSRCVSKHLKCRFDPNFQRISTRKLAQETVDQLHAQRAASSHLEDDSAPPYQSVHLTAENFSPPQSQHVSRGVSVSSSSSLPQLPPRTADSPWLELKENEVTLDQTIGDVIVNANRILKLFYHFGRYYYPHARFLSRVRSINELAQQSPLLFCTILLTSAERYENYDTLYDQLCHVLDELLGRILHIAIQKLEVVHALLILCLWPVPKMRNSFDPSHNYIGLAIQAATYHNCHHPWGHDHVATQYRGASDTPASQLDPVVQAMTWLYCFQISARISIHMGLPPLICSPQHVKSLKHARSLAADILTAEERFQIDLLDILCSSQTYLDNMDNPHAHYTMTETYNEQLTALKTATQAQWTWTTALDIQLESARLHVFAMTFIQDIPQHDAQTLLYQQNILQSLLTSASSLISTMTSLSQQEIAGHHFFGGVLTFYPKHYFLSLILASSSLFRFLISSRTPTQPQQSLAITRITEAHKIFQSFPDHRDAVRACIHIELCMSYIQRMTAETNRDLFIKTRLGASIVLDTGFRAAQQRHFNPLDGTTAPMTQWADMGDHYAHRLPLAPEQKVVSPLGKNVAVTVPVLSGDTVNDMVVDVGVWDAWNSYSNDFGIMNEPWLGDDAEFGVLGSQPSGGMALGVSLPEIGDGMNA